MAVKKEGLLNKRQSDKIATELYANKEFSELSIEVAKILLPQIVQLVQIATQSNQKEFLTRKETKEFFSISYVCLHDWIHKGIITPLKCGNRTYFERAKLIKTLLDSNIK